jgi:hypothetical protein
LILINRQVIAKHKAEHKAKDDSTHPPPLMPLQPKKNASKVVTSSMQLAERELERNLLEDLYVDKQFLVELQNDER